MPSSNIADTVKRLMNPTPTGTPIVPANPANRASRGSHQLNLLDDKDWDQYMRERYGKNGAAYVDDAYDMDYFRDPYHTYRREKDKRDRKRDPWDEVKGGYTTTTIPPKGNTIGYHGNSYGPYTGGSTYSPKKVYVQHKDGSLQAFTLPYDCNGWYDLAKQVYPLAQGTKDEGIVVPIDRCEFTYGEPAFNACVYQGTQDYITARWGRKLDDSDRRWLARHPLATDGGIPQEYTITAIQQLVAPYGMKVSRVRLRAGTLVLGEQIMQWAQALGCNPMALADRQTSNAKAAELMGMDEASANQLWRLEFSDRPLPGSIIGERGWTSTPGVSVGSFGGHARYLAPRAGAGDWFVSIQLSPEHEVDYLIAPPDPEYVERKGAATLKVGSTLDPNGELIAVKDGTKWRPWVDIKAGIPAPTTTVPVVTPPPAPTPQAAQVVSTPVDDVAFVRGNKHVKFHCTMCGDKHDDLDRAYDYSEIDVCIDCAEETWRGVNCPECHHEPTWNTIPYPLSIGSDAFDYQCQRCKAEFTVPFESTEPFMKALIEFSFHVFAAQLDDMTSYADDPMDVADLPISTTSQADGDYVWDQQIVD